MKCNRNLIAYVTQQIVKEREAYTIYLLFVLSIAAIFLVLD